MEAQLKAPGKFGKATKLDFESHFYILSNKNNNPTLKGCHYPKSKTIPSVDEVYMQWKDKKTGELQEGLRTIRYIPGESSIFADEQKVDDSDLNRLAKRLGVIRFVNGYLVVHGTEKTKRDYLDLCNWNKSNEQTRMTGKTTLFYKDEKDKRSQSDVDVRRKIHELQGEVFNANENELKAYCLTFEIKNYDYLSVNEMQTILVDMIQRDPLRFEKEMKSPLRKRKYWVQKAFEVGYLVYNREVAKVQYTIGGVKDICTVPGINSDDVVSYVTDLSMESSDINDLIDKIRQSINLKMSNKKIESLEYTTNDYEKVFKQALDKGIIFKSGPWFKFMDESLGKLEKGLEASIQVLKENDDLYKEVKRLLTVSTEK